MFFRNLPVISTCFFNFCLLSPLLLWCDCSLPLLSGAPSLPAWPWGSGFYLVILPMLLMPLGPYRTHIKHTFFILLGQAAAFHIPPCALPPQTCPLLSVMPFVSPSATSDGRSFSNGLRGCWKCHRSFDPIFFLLYSLAAGNLAYKAPGNHCLYVRTSASTFFCYPLPPNESLGQPCWHHVSVHLSTAFKLFPSDYCRHHHCPAVTKGDI